MKKNVINFLVLAMLFNAGPVMAGVPFENTTVRDITIEDNVVRAIPLTQEELGTFTKLEQISGDIGNITAGDDATDVIVATTGIIWMATLGLLVYYLLTTPA